MPGYELRERIDRPLSEVFDFVGTPQSDKHPHWEPEVISIRKVTDGPIRRGTEAVMIRKDFSPPRDVPYEVTEFEPNRMITLRSVEDSMICQITFKFAEAASAATDVSVSVRFEPHGSLRLMGSISARCFAGTERG